MKTKEEILLAMKSEGSACLDGRDIYRLVDFFSEEDLNSLGVELKEDHKGEHQPIELTREEVLKRLESDLDFAFEKALGERGISSTLMFYVIKMWNWILEEGLEDWSDEDYYPYGLPLFRATAEKYGFDSPTQ